MIFFDAIADHPAKFWRLFSDLPLDVQQDAKCAYRLFQSNPAHPGLQFKKLAGEDDIYSARIGLDYRALAVMKKDRVVWYWIGSHSDYDRLV
jgi:hypothetical protein